MDILFYKVLHLSGVVALFTALGAIITGNCESCKKLSNILHGVSLLLLLVSGFGMVAKLEVGFPGWVIAKLVIWLVLGASLVLAKKNTFKAPVLMGMVLACGILAAWLGVMKPF